MQTWAFWVLPNADIWRAKCPWPRQRPNQILLRGDPSLFSEKSIWRAKMVFGAPKTKTRDVYNSLWALWAFADLASTKHWTILYKVSWKPADRSLRRSWQITYPAHYTVLLQVNYKLNPVTMDEYYGKKSF